MSFADFEVAHMRRALSLAAQGLGYTAPNPLVGCVIARGPQVLAEGYHTRLGQAHAEVEALSRCVGDLRDATMYVTLEPCSHHGRTPPCTDAILKSGIRNLVIACLDPHPKARGGAEVLKTAGCHVRVGLLEEESRVLNHVFFDALRHRRPAISLKMAQSLNGFLARKDRSIRAISSPEAREYSHRLRASHQAILAGMGTILNDDPLLDARHFDSERSPIPVVIDRQGRLPADTKLLTNPKTILFTATDVSSESDRLVRLPLQATWVEIWERVLQELYSRGIQSLFVEGGSETASFLLSQGLVDWLYLFIGPQLFAEGGLGSFLVKEELMFQRQNMQVFGDTLFLEGRISCLPA